MPELIVPSLFDTPPRPPAAVRDRFRRLDHERQSLVRQRAKVQADLAAVSSRLAIAEDVKSALQSLTQQLFGDITTAIEKQLTLALQDVLEQPLLLKVTRGTRAGQATLSFSVERDGHPEDIMKGQGGSVANVLSVGLRLLAITTLNESEHRRFLVLDEQDCWLQPELIPRLVHIVHAAGRALGFQVLMISHHDVSAFERYADKIYQCTPTADGVDVREVRAIQVADG
jgi:hypothetical protein